jgi:NADPH:quinone reductase-like Zn-dependent oxidoreductase
MRALVFKRYGRPDQVTFADAPRPVPKPNEILVQVHAAGLNPIDNMIPKGTFKPILRFQLPATLGSDLAGAVVEVGSRVTRFKPGDAVFASIFDLGTGALADFALVPENAAALKPANLDFVEAATPRNAVSRIRSCSCIQTVANSQRSVSFSRRVASGR